VALPIGTTVTQLPIQRVDVPSPSPRAGEAPTASGASFGERLADLVKDASATQSNAETLASSYARGEQNDLHGTMIAMSQADVSLRFVANVRNRIVEAYREIMRMGA